MTKAKQIKEKLMFFLKAWDKEVKLVGTNYQIKKFLSGLSNFIYNENFEAEQRGREKLKKEIDIKFSQETQKPMTNKQLAKKIEEIMWSAPVEKHIWHMVGHRTTKQLISLMKEYALSCLPKEKKVKFNTDLGFNQCRNQTKEAIEGK